MPGAPGGTGVFVVAEAEEYVRGPSDPVSVKTGETVEGTVVELRPCGAVAGRVTDGDGKPLTGAFVQVTSRGEGKLARDQLDQAEGYLVDETGAGIAGATVVVWPLMEGDGQPHESSYKRAITRPDGSFTVIGVKDKLFWATAEKDGYTTVSAELEAMGGPDEPMVEITLMRE